MNRVLGRRHRERHRSRIAKYLVVVAALKSLVAKEVDLLEAVGLNLSQTESLVPALREDVEADLAAYWEDQIVVGELALEHLDELLSDLVYFVVGLKLIAFGLRGASAARRYVYKAVASLDEISSI